MIPISDDPRPARRSTPYVNYLLIAINVVVFLYQLSLGPQLEQFLFQWGVIPSAILGGQQSYLSLATSMFLHGGILHIAGNMLYLWIFGDNVEDRFGHFKYLVFYFLTGFGAAFAHIFLNPSSNLPSVGASGAIAGVLAAYIVMFPNAPIRTLLFIGIFFTITRLSAFILIGFWFVIQLISGLVSLGADTAQTAGVAFWAHIGGFVAGLILVKIFDRGAKNPKAGAWG